MTTNAVTKQFWNRVALENSAWYSATGFSTESEHFFATGARDVDAFLALAGVRLALEDTILEIGCGSGRMTRRLSSRARRVVAADVSSEMLSRASTNLEGAGNVDFLELSGDGSVDLPDGSVDAVFSYITMQHVSSSAALDKYLSEAIRVVRPGGWVVMQFRRMELASRALDWRGHIANFLRGKKTLNKSWRGAQIAESQLRNHRRSDVGLDILRLDARHVWVVAKRS